MTEPADSAGGAEGVVPVGDAADQGSGYRPGETAYRRVIVALFAAGVATFALLYAAQPLLPDFTAEFGVTPAVAAFSVSGTTLALGLALLVVGPSTEVLGRTPIIIASLFASSIVGVLVAVAPSWPVLLGLRALQGLALAGIPAVVVAYLREEIDDSAHGVATGVYIGGTAIGGMVGRLVVGGVTDLAGWRWGLAAVALMGLVCAVYVHLLLPRSRFFRPVAASRRGMVETTRRLLSDPALVALYLVGAVAMGSFVATFNTIGFRLRGEPYLLGVAVSGLIYLSYASGSFSSAYAGRLADRLGRRTVLPVFFALTLVGLLVTLAAPLWLVAVGITMFAAGFFAVHGVASAWVAARAHAGGGGTGQATAFYLFCYYLGSSVFGAWAGTAWSTGGWPRVVEMTGALVLVGVGLGIWLQRIPTLAEPPVEDEGVTAY